MTTTTIDPGRVAALDTLTIDKGAHDTWEDGHCALEVVAWLAGEHHSDSPVCVCPAIARFVRRWNDDLPDDESRERLLRPVLPRLVGTAGDAALTERRSWMAADWAVMPGAGPSTRRVSGSWPPCARATSDREPRQPRSDRAGLHLPGDGQPPRPGPRHRPGHRRGALVKPHQERIVAGDCLEAMAAMDEASVDAIVCDPPYGLGFMGKEWDRLSGQPGYVERGSMQKWHHAWATEALRVLKPGGHLLAFGGSRTYHRLACGIEDAGFEIRDQIQYLYGSGFPKGLNLDTMRGEAFCGCEAIPEHDLSNVRGGDVPATEGEPRTLADEPGAQARGTWPTCGGCGKPRVPRGLGTALKPAHEPIVMARKPLAGTVAANVQQHGTGALNVDGCRVGVVAVAHAFGRWPANLILDPEAGAMLDEQSGSRPGGNYPTRRSAPRATGFGVGQPTEGGPRSMGDTGGASRFFYCPKASSAERNAGLDGYAEAMPHDNAGHGGIPGSHSTRRANHHPTVKPIALMRWLVRLVTPPGGLVLDPFAGSGTTGIACVLEGFDFAGIEREPEYAQIARARIAHAQANPLDFDSMAGQLEPKW